MRLALLLSILLAVAPLVAPGARAEEQDDAFSGFARAPDASEAPGPDGDLFREGVALQAKGSYRAARRRFFRLLEEYPDSPYAPEAEDRSGPNAFLGYTLMNEPRPSARRIDVALMGDGYLFDRQDRFDKDAVGHLAVLLKEPTLAEYEPYFNFWRFNLASKDDGVDEVAREPPDEEVQEHLRKRHKARKVRTFETALDCKAAGPQGQVAANPSCVWHYLAYLDVNDALAICFAKKGALGMGGMGIATTGPRGVVVHEFGHAFTGLLDEYAIYPGPPSGATEAANTTMHPDVPPWQHFLDADYPGVGVYEGGATFQKGVWRPAQNCAMNTGGNTYCPVCREATVLMIYTYVSPIDVVRPTTKEVVRGKDGWPVIEVQPMCPRTHELEVTWVLGDEPPGTAEEEEHEATPEDAFGEDMLTPEERKLWEKIKKRREQEGRTVPASSAPVKRGLVRRWQGTANDPPPPGEPIRDRKRKAPGGARVHAPVLPDLGPGRYLLTAVVKDTTQPRGERRPWVLKDEKGLLEDRHAFVLVVPEPDAPDGPDGGP